VNPEKELGKAKLALVSQKNDLWTSKLALATSENELGKAHFFPEGPANLWLELKRKLLFHLIAQIDGNSIQSVKYLL
jgi:hypothetical protein